MADTDMLTGRNEVREDYQGFLELGEWNQFGGHLLHE